MNSFALEDIPTFTTLVRDLATSTDKQGILESLSKWPVSILLSTAKLLLNISNDVSTNSSFNHSSPSQRLFPPLSDFSTSNNSPSLDTLSISSSSTFSPSPPQSPLLNLTLDISQPIPKGSLTLVGAGPGDPSLLTLAAITALKSADTIVSDRLVPQPLISLIRTRINPSATIILSRKPIPHIKCTSKISAADAQSEIYETCIRELRNSKSVVRLKNGDPFVFGRGGEEVLVFEKLGIKVSVIPGISSAFAAALAARIPVTHRGVADQIVVATGWRRDQDDDLEYLRELEKEGGDVASRKMYPPKSDPAEALPVYGANRTVVLLMAISKLDGLTKHMLLSVEEGGLGYPKTLPAAIVEKATWSDKELGDQQQVIKGTLEEIAKLSKIHGVKHHSTVVIGNVVNVLSN